MDTQKVYCFILLIAATTSGAAEDSCGLRAVNLLASGKAKEVAAMFAKEADVLVQLRGMSETLGKVTDIREVSGPRFTQHKRLSIQSKELPHVFAYDGHWINARSDTLGTVQFHVAEAPGGSCQLYAIHMDTAQ